MKKIRHILTIALACASLATSAQEKFKPKGQVSYEITKEQRAKMDAIQKRLDQRIEAAFKGNEKLKTEMQGELKQLSAMKDSKSQMAAAAEYQKKYGNAYAEVLKKGGVDLNSVAKELQSVLTNYRFTVQNMGIFAAVGTEDNAPVIPTVPTPPAGPKSTRITNFNDHRDNSCGLGAGSSIMINNNSIKVFSLAAVGGGCFTGADMYADFIVPKANSAKLRVRYKVSIEGFAVGVGGTSGANIGASCYINSAGRVFRLFKMIFAPVFWVATTEEEINETKTFNLPADREREDGIVFDNETDVLAFISETHAESKTSNIEVTLITE